MQFYEIRKPRLDTLAERLRIKRKEVGWTQEQLAQKVGSSQAVIQKIENGKSLRPRKLNEIADALGVDPAWLMFGVESTLSVDEDFMELAEAWSKLDASRRAALKQQILREAATPTMA